MQTVEIVLPPVNARKICLHQVILIPFGERPIVRISAR
jgi:hypothetical protein